MDNSQGIINLPGDNDPSLFNDDPFIDDYIVDPCSDEPDYTDETPLDHGKQIRENEWQDE